MIGEIAIFAFNSKVKIRLNCEQQLIKPTSQMNVCVWNKRYKWTDYLDGCSKIFF